MMETMFFILFLWNFIANCTAVRYDNYSLLSGTPYNESHLVFLRGLKDRSGFDVNFWTEPGALQKPVEFTIAPGNKTLFLEQAKKLSMPIIVLQENIQKLFDQENTMQFYSRGDLALLNWQYYFGLDAIYAWLRDLAKTRAPEIQIHKIGKSYERRDILAAFVVLKGSAKRSKVFIEGGIHAREWISPAFVTFMIDRILNAPQSQDEELKKIAMTYEWYFVPVVNPDGYEYSHKVDRMWRKNRKGLNGVDLNRNFGYKFEVNARTDPYGSTYPGNNPFSEPESMALRNYIKYIGDGLEYYLSFHSFGQYMIIPYGHTPMHLENYNEVNNMALRAASVIHSVYQTMYTVGTAADTVGYTLGGVSTCWVKNTFKVPYVLTFELRDKGQHGFALQSHLIKPTCIETLAGVVSFLTPSKGNYEKVKNEYRQSLEKYHINGHSGSHVVLFKIVIVLNVFWYTLGTLT